MKKLALIALCTALLPFSARAVFMESPEPAPVERLVRNAEAYLARHQNEADAHYTLARIHYLAFSMKRQQVPAFIRGKAEGAKPRPARHWEEGWARIPDEVHGKKVAELSPPEITAHALAAVASFRETLRLAPKNGLYMLGLASLWEEIGKWKATAKPENLPDSLKDITFRHARETYARAFALALPADARIRNQTLNGLGSITSFEAAEGLIRLSKNAEPPLTAAEKKNLEDAKAAVERMKQLPPGPVTPIAFSYQPAAHLAGHLAPEKIVDFDLRGHGTRERWPWVKPDLGFLVWDPLREGRITSARQMFGGYTFQIFRRNGYDALRALDDNADGQLTGSELDGLSVWFDRDSDGRSSAAEVTPLERTDITAIAVTAESQDDIHPMNPRGLTLRDGRTLPTWDWIVTPESHSPTTRR